VAAHTELPTRSAISERAAWLQRARGIAGSESRGSERERGRTLWVVGRVRDSRGIRGWGRGGQEAVPEGGLLADSRPVRLLRRWPWIRFDFASGEDCQGSRSPGSGTAPLGHGENGPLRHRQRRTTAVSGSASHGLSPQTRGTCGSLRGPPRVPRLDRWKRGLPGGGCRLGRTVSAGTGKTRDWFAI